MSQNLVSRIHELMNFISRYNNKYAAPQPPRSLAYAPNYRSMQRRVNAERELRQLIAKHATLKKAINKFKAPRNRRRQLARRAVPQNTLARTVFHPNRVKRMQAMYGPNWLNRI